MEKTTPPCLFTKSLDRRRPIVSSWDEPLRFLAAVDGTGLTVIVETTVVVEEQLVLLNESVEAGSEV